MNFLRLLWRFQFLAACVASGSRASAEELSVAAAANLVHVTEPLKSRFETENPGTTVRFVVGASGSLYAQIAHGAPHHVFMSADTDYPRQLVAAGAGHAASLRTFAVGRLALWSANAKYVSGMTLEEALKNPALKRLAIANPQAAPYGRASLETLAHLGLADSLRDRLVTAENISQATQFVETGNAQAGFVALSHLVSPKLKGKGAYIEVPATSHRPLEHAVVLTARGTKFPAANAFIAFLAGKSGREILTRAGYGVPAP